MKLTASIDQVSLSAKPGTLVTDLTGSFSLELDVGDLASGSDTLGAAPTFQAVGPDGTGVGLDAIARDGTFPLTLSAGSHQSIAFTLTDQNELSSADRARLCGGSVHLVATFRDSLGGDRATTVQSDSVTVVGCS